MDNLGNIEVPITIDTEKLAQDIVGMISELKVSNTATVKIKRLRPEAKLPIHGSRVAAGYDFFAAIQDPITIPPHKTVKIGSGLAIAVPEDFWLGLFARSGLATKEGLRPANCIGVIDSDYRGQVIAAIHNDSDEIRLIYPDERIGQLILIPKYDWDIQEVEDLDDTERGEGGFGSTGTN